MINFEEKIIEAVKYFMDDSKKIILSSTIIIPISFILSFIPISWISGFAIAILIFFLIFLILGIINYQINKRLLQNLKRIKIYNTYVITKKKVKGEDGYNYFVKVHLENKQKTISISEEFYNQIQEKDKIVISKYDLWYKHEEIPKYTGNTFTRIDIQ